MSYCLNPYCSRRQNSEAAKFCSHCGFKLLLGDRYRAVEPIGRGGFGRTFRAIDEYKPSHPTCVIKQFFPLRQNLQDMDRSHDLFRREAIQLERLGQHPQIPELLAHFEQDDYHYLVQEYIDGRNLAEELEEHGPFTELQVWYLLNDLLPVLEFLHTHQVIHRDIKPQNIIRRHTNRQSVLVDFGAAKSVAGVDFGRTGTSIGSPEFAAPEQAIGKATYMSDLYSLGVTCIYLMTQIRPSELFDTEEGCWAWRSHLPSGIHGPFGELLDRLLQAPLKRRYQSAREVLTDLNSPAVRASLGMTEGAAIKVPAPAFRPAAPSSSTLVNPPAAPLPTTALPEFETMPLWTCHRTLTGHVSWVRSVGFHPIEPLLASGSGDRTLKIWHQDTGELKRTISAHTSWVRAIALSPNGDLLASCSNDRTIKLWDWQTGELQHTLTGHTDWVRAIAFSPNSDGLLSGSQDKTLSLWQASTGKRLMTLTGHTHWVTAVAYFPRSDSGNLLISGSRDTTIRLWSGSTGKLLTLLEGHTGSVNALTVSPIAQLLASASEDRTIRVWNLQTGSLLHILAGHQGAVNAIAISPDSTLLVSGSHDKTVKLWCLKTGSLLQTLTGHSNWVWSVAFSPHGELIASGGWDATIKLWHRQT